MKIVQLYKDYYPPTFGGIEKTVERYARWMVGQGAQVTVLTSHPGSLRTIRETVDGVQVIRCGEWARTLSTPLCPSMPMELSRLEADLYHLHYPSPPGEVSWLWARPKGRMVVTWHGEIVRQKAAIPIYGRVVHAVLREADAIMPTSDRQEPNSQFLPRYTDKLHVVPLGIDLHAPDTQERHAARAAALRSGWGSAPIVLFAGRMVVYKGLDVLLEAMPSVNAKCIIVGAGPEYDRLRAKSAALGLNGKVVFTGRLDGEVLVDHLAAADVGVLPSIGAQETFGLAMVEMMSLGLPMVCTELGTGTSFVNRHGETGLVVAPNDPPALAGALNQLLANEPLRRQMGQNAKQRAHRMFSAEAMMRGVMDVYESVLARR